MPKNLELKARYARVRKAELVAKRIGAVNGGALSQTDTYVEVPPGRLKFREAGPGKMELIWYRRMNKKGARYSTYKIIRIPYDPRIVRAFCEAFGKLAVVQNRRHLFLYRNARIHLDRVRNLGSFLEFEVQVEHGNEQARRLMKFLTQSFGIRPANTISHSYGDMVIMQQRRRKR